MITRGLIIGKIIDDIANLQYQIQLRSKFKLYDLSQFVEDFFREVLNTLYGYDLINLNNERSNNPGIDLGDKNKKIAFQVTSRNDAKKVKDTLEKVSSEQIKDFPFIKILIVGDKKNTYNISSELLNKCEFDIKKNIVDLNDLLKDVVVADILTLESLYRIFQIEFRQVRIELEPIDSEGNFESSLFNQLESIPQKKPKNANKFSGKFEDDGLEDSTISLQSVLELYSKLSKIPRVTRELIPIIAERGKKRIFNHSYEEYGILPQTLQNYLRLTNTELMSEITILLDSDLIYTSEEDVSYITISGRTLNELIDWTQEYQRSLKKMFNVMDWTFLDE